MNIIGEGSPEEIRKQIIQRQKIYGSGYIQGTLRSPEQILYLNANTSWCKLVSSVNVTDIDIIKNNSLKSLQELNGEALARRFVLFNGVYEHSPTNDGELRAGIDTSKSLLGNNNAYGIGGTEFGLRPMMGIQSAEIKHANRGSIRQATVKIKAWNKIQFDIIDLLYLRLGFNILLEWGHSMWYDNAGNLHNGSDIDLSLAEPFLSGKGPKEITTITTTTPPPTPTLIGNVENQQGPSLPPQNVTPLESTTTINTSTIIGDLTYVDFLALINRQRIISCGNYDAMFAKITNFHWTFNKDGSYDITLDLISVGDVAESFKINLLNSNKQTSTSKQNTDKPLEEQSDKDVAAYFSERNSIASWFSDIINQPMLEIKPEKIKSENQQIVQKVIYPVNPIDAFKVDENGILRSRETGGM